MCKWINERFFNMSDFEGTEKRIPPDGRRGKDQSMTATLVDIGLIIAVMIVCAWAFKIDAGVGSARATQESILKVIQQSSVVHNDCHENIDSLQEQLDTLSTRMVTLEQRNNDVLQEILLRLPPIR